MVNFFFTKYMANDDLNPLNALIPKIPFSFFADFWVWATFEARGSVSLGFWGSCRWSPFWGGAGSGRRALSSPPPPANENTASLGPPELERGSKGAEGWAVGCGPSEADCRCGTVPERPGARVRPGLTQSFGGRCDGHSPRGCAAVPYTGARAVLHKRQGDGQPRRRGPSLFRISELTLRWTFGIGSWLLLARAGRRGGGGAGRAGLCIATKRAIRYQASDIYGPSFPPTPTPPQSTTPPPLRTLSDLCKPYAPPPPYPPIPRT